MKIKFGDIVELNKEKVTSFQDLHSGILLTIAKPKGKVINVGRGLQNLEKALEHNLIRIADE